MAPTTPPLLTTTNWNEEWKHLQVKRNRSDNAAEWDKRAKSFPVKHGSQTGYVKRFLELADIKPGESVLDMGCGTGALATPLAQSGHEVLACDFSRGMLDVMLADQEELGVEGVSTKVMSWDDDWSSYGIEPKSVDVALASRSIATFDLEASLMKLDHVARRRVCITLPSGPNPKVDDRLLAAAGLQRQAGRDFLYAFNILASKGINPEVAYIPSSRVENFETIEDAVNAYSAIVENASREFAEQPALDAIPARLESWLKGNLVHDAAGYHLAEPRRVTWAFIAWSPLSE